MSLPTKTCTECGAEFYDAPNRKGFINRCDGCSKPKPTEEQQNRWEEAGRYFVNSDGEEIRYEVVKTIHR